MFNKIKINLILLIIFFSILSCAYYNTMYNAEKLYDEGTLKIANSKDGKISADIKNNFNSAIDKCWTLINVYSDSNKWADDALLLIGKSHYLIEEYTKSERFLNQFILKYPKSDLIYEAKIWYAKVMIKLDNDDKALENLNNILVDDMNSELKAESYSSIGSIYYKRGDFEEAIKYLEKCVEISYDDILSASSQLLIGNIYFKLERYVDAIENYNFVLEFDPVEEIEFQALISKVDAQLALNKIDLAIKTLNQMLRNTKIKEKYSLVEAKLGDCFRLEGKTDFAAEHYLDVMQEYPRSLGSAKASYELAKLLEFHYHYADSAMKMYSNVKQQSNNSEYVEDAANRANLLKKYLELKGKIKTNYETIKDPFGDTTKTATSLTPAITDTTIGDSILALVEDSLSFSPDSIDALTTVSDSDSVNIIDTEYDKIAEREKLIKNAENSLAKNQYALAEFFMLSMENYDSAAAAYTKFIDFNYDSTRIPQAYHALSYLYSHKLSDSTKADSIDDIILNNYIDTPFSEYILMRRGEISKDVDTVSIDTLKSQYRNAEEYLFSDDYGTALNLFGKIAERDSGNAWAGKSRYAISWIYENKLKDIAKAIESYTTLVNEYPGTEYAKIGKNKIKEPKIEIPPDTTKADSLQMNDSTYTNSLQMSDSTYTDSLTTDEMPEEGNKENPEVIENPEESDPEINAEPEKSVNEEPAIKEEEETPLNSPTASNLFVPVNKTAIKEGEFWIISAV